MPNCFSLTRTTDKDAGPVSLKQVDDEMRRHFKEPVGFHMNLKIG